MYKALDWSSLNIVAQPAQAIELAAQNGFAGVMLNPDDVARDGVQTIADALEENRLANAGFWAGHGFLEEGNAYWEGLKTLARQAAVARATGAVRAITYILPASEERDYEEQYAFLAKRIRPYAQVMADEGIALALEFIGNHDGYANARHPFIHTMHDMMRLCDSIGVRGCGLLVDSHHMYTAGHDMDALLDIRADQIAFVHISDACPGYTAQTQPGQPRLLPGMSNVVDNARMLKNLRRIGYEGPVVVEPFYQPFAQMGDAQEKVRMAKAALDAVWG